LNQIVVQFLVTVMNEAQEVDIHHPFTQLAKPVNGVIAHQGSVVFDVLVGDFQMRQQFLVGVLGHSVNIGIKTFLLIECGMAVLSPLLNAVISDGNHTHHHRRK